MNLAKRNITDHKVYSGIISLVPSELYYENTTIVYTDKRKYTVGDFEELFSDIGSNVSSLHRTA